RAHAEDEPRDAIVLVDLQNALRKPAPLINLPIGQHCQEGAAEELVVAGIAPQRGAVIRRRRGGVALTIGVPSGEIAARRRGPGKGIARLQLRPGRHHSRPSYGECGECGHSRMLQEWRSDHGSSTPSADETPLDRSLAQLRTAPGPHGVERVPPRPWSPVPDPLLSPPPSPTFPRPHSP